MTTSGRAGKSTWNHDGPPLRGLYRDRENGWIFGVCAGLAEYANFRTLTVRIVVTACLVLFFVPTALAYIAAILILRDRPLTYRGRCREHDFWRCRRDDDGRSPT